MSIADDIINGDIDQYTGEWLGNGQGYPRSSHGVRSSGPTTVRDRITGKTRSANHDPANYAKGTKAIRKELAILIKIKHESCTTEKEKNKAVEKARQEINLKYGKGWREQY